MFALPPARQGLLSAATPAFGLVLESSCLFLVAKPSRFSYLSGLLTRNDTSLTSRVRRLAMFKFVVSSIGAFFQTGGYRVPRHNSSRMW